MFSKKDRIAVASDLADEFEDAYKNKEYSFMENVNEQQYFDPNGELRKYMDKVLI